MKDVYITDLRAWCNCVFDGNPLYLGENLYLNGELVTELIIPDGVERIADNAFSHCDSLISVIIPDSVKAIGKSAFSNCGPLPKGASSLGGEVFSGEGLKEITLTNSVIDIGRDAFYNCNNLKNVYYRGTDAEWADVTNDIGKGNSPLKDATINYMPFTKTSVSVDRKTFTVVPLNVEEGKNVVFALYKDDVLVDIQFAEYEGEAIPFTTDKVYDEAKVMVWDKFTNLMPVCGVEIVK